MKPEHSTSAARRDSRAQIELAHEAAKWIQQEASTQSFITVTHVVLTTRGTRATIYVSIFPETEIRAALAFLTRERGNFATHLREHARIRPIPMVEFALDDGSTSAPPANLP